MDKRLSSVLVLAVVLTCGNASIAQESDPARALIERAVQAQGGLEVLSLELAGHRKSKGIFHTEGFHYEGDSYSEPGGKRRIVLKGEMNALPATRILVMIDSKTGWVRYLDALGEITLDLDAKFLDRIDRSVYADRVCGLVTLLKDEGYTLTLLPEEPIKDKPALGVKVARDGKPDVSLWFDKETTLLVKSANKTIEPDFDREVLQEIYYSDYRRLSPAEPEERLLRQAKVSDDGPALLAFLLKRIPDETEQLQMKDLILKLGHKSFGVRQKASADIVGYGIKAAAPLRAAAQDSDREVARRAEQALAEVAASDDPELTAAVLRLTALRKPAEAVAVLLDYFSWAPDEKVRHEVLCALAELDGAKAQQNPVLTAALKDTDPQRRAAAEAALGADGGEFLKRGWRRVYVEGLYLPMKTALYRENMQGRKEHFMDIETTEILFYNRLDDSLFTRP